MAVSYDRDKGERSYMHEIVGLRLFVVCRLLVTKELFDLHLSQVATRFRTLPSLSAAGHLEEISYAVQGAG